MNQQQTKYFCKRVDEIAAQRKHDAGWAAYSHVAPGLSGGFYAPDVHRPTVDEMLTALRKDKARLTITTDEFEQAFRDLEDSRFDVPSVMGAFKRAMEEKAKTLKTSHFDKLMDDYEQAKSDAIKECRAKCEAIDVETQRLKDAAILGDADAALAALQRFEHGE